MSEAVEACYDWKGNITQYRSGERWIPVDLGNRDYQELIERFGNATIQAVPPQFARAVETHGKNGKITGYNCESLFVPNQPGNPIYEILKRQIETGTCSVMPPATVVPMEQSNRIELFQVGVVFERQ